MDNMTTSTFPDDVAAIDTMMGTRAGPNAKLNYANLTGIRDADSKAMNFPAQYMFKDVPFSDQARDADGRPLDPPQGADLCLPFMDRNNVQIAMVGIGPDKSEGRSMVEAHPDRFVACHEPDPNDVPGMLRTVRQLHRDAGLKAVTAFPSGRDPQVPIDDPKMYELYELCCELGIPVFCCAGIPGPRVPFAPQRVELIDQVMYDFPDLVFVTRHGCEPWQDLMVKLMLKWPNLYYSTSAFAPKHYPKAIIDYANSRGADKVIYAGYFPMGLSLDRIFTELRDVPLKAEVWPKFLRENAIRVLGLDA
jgi:hypothetical protein